MAINQQLLQAMRRQSSTGVAPTTQKEGKGIINFIKSPQFGETIADLFGLTTAVKFGQMLPRAIGTGLAIKESTKLSEATGALADLTTKMIKRIKDTPEGPRKERMKNIVRENLKQMKVSKKIQKKLEREMLPTGKRGATYAAGLTGKTAMTAITASPGYSTAYGMANLKGRMAMGAATAAGFAGSTQLQKEGEITKERVGQAAAIGAAVPVAIEAGSIALRFIGGVLKRVGSTITGKSRAIFDTIFKRPSAAEAGLKGDAAKVMKQTGLDVRKGIQILKKEASEEFADDIAKFPKHDIAEIAPLTARERAAGITRVKSGGKEVSLSLKGIKARFTRILHKNKVQIDTKAGTLNVSQSTLRKSEERILQEILDVINGWKDTSPEGIETLAEKINHYIKGGYQSKHLNLIISNLKDGARNYLAKKVPELRPVIEKYSQRMDFIDDISNAVSIKGAFESPKGIRQTATRLDNLFGSNKELTRDIITQLEQKTGIEVLGTMAGKEIGEVPTTGGLGGIIRGLMQAVIPPEATGNIAIFFGKTKEQIQPFIEALQKLEPEARVALFNLITEKTK